VDIGTRYVDYVVPGVLLLCAVTGAATTAVTVCQDMTGGIIDRFRSLDVPGTAVLAGHVTASLLRNIASTVLVTAVAFGIGFRPHSSVARFAAAFGVLLLFVAAVSWLAAAFGLLVSAPEAANSAMFFLMFFSYASSAFVPVRTMPSWLRGFSLHQPATPVTETIRGLLLRQPGGVPLGRRWPGAAASWPSRSRSRRGYSAAARSETSKSRPADAGDLRVRGPDQVGGGKLDLQAAPPATAEHGGEAHGGRVEHHREPLALADRGDAAGYVPGGPFGRRHLGHGGLLAAASPGERLEVELAFHRDHPRHQVSVHLGDQRLEHAVRRDAQGLARLAAVGLVPGVVGVLVHRERDPGPLERYRRRRAASCHNWSP